MGRRSWVAALAVAVVAVAGCSGGGDSATTSDTALATALSYVPDDATAVRFGDSMPWLKAHGFAGKSPKALLNDDRFLGKLPRAAFPESNLWVYLRIMDDWGWTAADIAWSATADIAGPDATKSVHFTRFRDTTDLGTVKKSLISHGYRVKGAALLGPPLSATEDEVESGIIVSIGHRVRFFPDKHLMVASNYVKNLELPSDTDSFGQDPTVRTVVEPIAKANYVEISAGTRACVSSTRAPRQLEQLKALGQVSGTATAVLNDTKSIATAAYPSQDAAESDLPRRKNLLSGDSPVSARPYHSIAHFDLSRKDATLRYQITAKPWIPPQMLRNRDAPWAMCGGKGSTSTD